MSLEVVSGKKVSKVRQRMEEQNWCFVEALIVSQNEAASVGEESI